MTDLDEPVHLTAHDPAWAARGREAVGEIAAALHGLSAEVAHIGSTAVPGLVAKPVVDIQIGCPDADAAAAVRRLEGLAYEHLGQAGVPGREYLRRRSGQPVNAHVVQRRGRLWTDNILFRDYLRTHPDAASQYAAAKREAVGRAPNLLEYSELKARTVARIMA
ncbi:GrpB family protein, partial [Streptomyces sp. NPDC057654]|uniref:GrpB family protein n=1 Tax=Streptomyces sp. NPDC057654 TaxID=3346196 RepID=UPI0036D0C876